MVVVLCQLLLTAGGTILGFYFAHHRLLDALDYGIRAHSISLAALVRQDASGSWRWEKNLQPENIDEDSPDLFLIRIENGPVVARSTTWDNADNEMALRQNGYWALKHRGIDYRCITLHHLLTAESENSDRTPGYVDVVYATGTSEMWEEITTTGVAIGIGGVALLLVTLPLAYWGMKRGLRPLSDLEKAARNISAHDMEFDAPESAKSVAELNPLIGAIENSVSRLRTTFRQQKEFLGDAAHELKTPIAVLKSTLQLLGREARKSEGYETGVSDALEDLNRLEGVVQRMLRLAKAEHHALKSNGSSAPSVEVGKTCQTAIVRIAALAQTRNVSVEFQASGKFEVLADPEDLVTIWVNLLENAVDYSPDGGVVRIELRPKEENGVEVCVSDEGPGIPRDHLDTIFQRFYRADPSRSRATGGSGLGLPIARALTESLGGNIRASNGSEKGACLRVCLPLYSSVFRS